MTRSTPSPAGTVPRTGTHAAGDDAPRDGAAPAAVLHVEPDDGSAELLSALLAVFADDSAIRSVDGVAAALDVPDGVDCIVTEQRLPDGSGIELLERLRARSADVPVVFYTTCHDAATEARALDAGADGYFTKCPAPAQFRCLVERLCDLVDGVDVDAHASVASPATDRRRE